MPTLPIAAFLVGSLLTILVPLALLSALGIWYWVFSARAPEAPRERESRLDPAEATPAPDVPQALPPDPAV